MRILMLSPIFPYPPHSGSRDRIYNILIRLARRNEVTLVIFDEEKDHAARQHLENLCYQVVPVYRKRMPKWKRRLKSLLSRDPYEVVINRSTAMQTAVKEIVRNQQFDLLYCHSTGMAQYARLFPGIKILDQHDANRAWWERHTYHDPNPLARLLARDFLQRTIAYEDGIMRQFVTCFCVSGQDLEITKEFAHSTLKLMLAPNGVDVAYYSPRSEPVDPNNVVFCGSIRGRMNEDAVLHFAEAVLPRIESVVPQVTFTIVGREPGPKVLQLASRPNIAVTGYVPDVRPYLAQAAVVVAPFRLGGGTKLKILQALAMGKALVTTSVGCQGIDIRADHHALIADSAEAFAASVARLLQDPAYREEMGKRARQLVVDRYDWNQIVDDIERHLLGLMPDGG